MKKYMKENNYLLSIFTIYNSLLFDRSNKTSSYIFIKKMQTSLYKNWQNI